MKNNILLSILALLSVALLLSVKSTEKSSEIKFFTKKPQEYMRYLSVTLFDENGIIKNKLSADYWGYLPEKKISSLKNPHLTIFRLDGTQWLIHSKHGQVTQPDIGTIQTITLQEDVVLKRPANALTMPLSLQTEELSYEPKNNFAKSECFVRLVKPGMTITGVGLRAFLDKGSVELLNNVKTDYTINP